MNFEDAIRLLKEGNTITRDNGRFINPNSRYRFTFADRLSKKWRVYNEDDTKYTSNLYIAPKKGKRYFCANCRDCENSARCPNNGYCYLYDEDKAPRPHYSPLIKRRGD